MRSVSTLMRCGLLLSVALLLLADAPQAGNQTHRIEGFAKAQGAKKFCLTGRLKEEGAAKGIGKTKLQVVGLSDTDSEEAFIEGMVVDTDDDGRFKFEAKFGRHYKTARDFAVVNLRIQDGAFAFPAHSVAWVGFNSKVGDYSIGDLLVVKGGQIRVNAVHQVTGAPIPCPVCAEMKASYVRDVIFRSENGTGLSPMLPPGIYEVWPLGGLGAVREKVTVKAGEIADVEIRALPKYATTVELYGMKADLPANVYAKPTTPDEEYKLWAKGNADKPGYPISSWAQPRFCQADLNEGEWEIICCDAKGKAFKRERITVPLQAPARVFLGNCGAAAVTALDRNGEPIDCGVCLLDPKTETYAANAHLQPGDYGEELSLGTEGETNVLIPVLSRFQPATRAVNAGKYLMLASTTIYDNFGQLPLVIARAEVEVVKGQVLQVQISLPDSRLGLKLTRGGMPAADTEVCAWQGDKLPPAEDCTVKSDGRGLLSKEASLGLWYVATPRELAWLHAAPGGDLRHRLERIPQVRVGATPREQTVDIGASPWVTIELTGESAEDAEFARLVPGNWKQDSIRDHLYFASRERAGSVSAFSIGPTPAGKYKLEVGFDPVAIHEVDVVAGDNTFRFDGSQHKLELSATLPDGSVPDELEFVVRPNLPGHYSIAEYWKSLEATAGRAEIEVRAGHYQVAARARKGDRILNVGSRTLNLTADTEVALLLSKDVGAIDIAIDYGDGKGRGEALYFVAFQGKVVLPDSAEASSARQPFSLHGLPDGKYTFDVRSFQHMPARVSATVKKGEAVTAEVKVKPTLSAGITLSGITESMLRSMYEGCVPLKGGKELPFETPAADAFGGYTAVGSSRVSAIRNVHLYIEAIPPTADTVRIKLRGYATLDVRLGKTPERLSATPVWK